jgi:hypothetical protein
MKNKHFKKWVSDLVKTFITVTFVLGILYGISESLESGVLMFSILLMVVSFLLRNIYVKSSLFYY